MSDYLFWGAIWVAAALVFGPGFGRLLRRRRLELEAMAEDVERGLDAHYERSGRPGMSTTGVKGGELKRA